jgi:uncharacterized repeat protein (TIGR01451 family)
MEENGLMNKRIRNVASRFVAIGLPLVLLGSMAVWSVRAQDRLPDAGSAPAQYEVDLNGFQAEQLEVVVPDGFDYAGPAPGSDVTQRPDVSKDGSRLVWQAPFPEGGTLRFWLASLGSDEAPAALTVEGADVQALHVEPQPPRPVDGEVAVSSDVANASVTVEKTVTPEELDPGDYPLVTYEVVFTNSAAEPVVLAHITDTLPTGFDYFTPATYPAPTVQGSDLIWTNVEVPGTGSKTLGYNVVPEMYAGTYSNHVVAVAGSQTIGPASADVEVTGPQVSRVFVPAVLRNYTPPAPVWHVTKTANPTQVEPGDPAIYQVVINNAGNANGTLSRIDDALPSGFTFGSMSGGDINQWPSGTTGTISWSGAWTLPPSSSLTLRYQVTTGGGGNQANTVTIYDLYNEAVGTASSTIAVLGGLPYEENFDVNPPPDWQPFLNYPGLDADRWFAAGGVYNYDSTAVLPENTGFDLSIYNAPGAQGWTDYRIVTRMKDVKDHNLQRGLTGVWFRGTYQDSGANDGKEIAGYYFYIRPDNDTLYLMRTDPSIRSLNSQPIIGSVVYGPRIGRKHWYDVIIEVQGPNIKIQFGDPENGMIEAFNVTDSTYPNGTVGFAEYYTASRYDFMRVEPLD